MAHDQHELCDSLPGCSMKMQDMHNPARTGGTCSSSSKKQEAVRYMQQQQQEARRSASKWMTVAKSWTRQAVPPLPELIHAMLKHSSSLFKVLNKLNP
jgi:hypothetical protein